MMQIPKTLTKKNRQETFQSKQIYDSLANGNHKKTKQIKKIQTTPTIHNIFQKNKVNDEGESKVSAKEIKRLREQNRRANHKEYVGRIEAELEEKQQEVAILSEKINQLTEKLESLSYSKFCSKCNAELSENSVIQINSQELQELDVLEKEQAEDQIYPSPEMQIELSFAEEDFFDENFIERVRNDEGSLKVNFGSNFMFIFITFCCLSAGCIADNAQLALEPIMPYRVKSQMCYLPTPANLDKIRIFTPLQKFLNTPGYQLFRKECGPLLLEEDIYTVGSSLKIDFQFSFSFPDIEEVGNWIFDSKEGLASLSSNFILRNFVNGHNYYG